MNRLSIFLENKKQFLFFSIVYALFSVVGIVLIVQPDMENGNNLCLSVLGIVYIILFLVLFLRGSLNRWIHASRCTEKHFMISIVLAFALLLLCDLNVTDIRNNNLRKKEMSKCDKLYVSMEKDSEQDDRSVVLRGLIYDGNDYNMYEIALPEPWYFTKEGFIRVDQETDASILIPLRSDHIQDIYVLTGPKAGTVGLRVGSLSAVYSLYTEEEGETALDLKRLTGDKMKFPIPIFYQILVWLIGISLLSSVLLPLVVHFQYLFQKK